MKLLMEQPLHQLFQRRNSGLRHCPMSYLGEQVLESYHCFERGYPNYRGRRVACPLCFASLLLLVSLWDPFCLAHCCCPEMHFRIGIQEKKKQCTSELVLWLLSVSEGSSFPACTAFSCFIFSNHFGKARVCLEKIL